MKLSKCLQILMVVGVLAFGVLTVSAQPVVIEQVATGGLFGEGIELVAELFNSVQSDVRVEVTQMAGAAALVENLVARVAGGTPPDVVAGSGRFGELLAWNLLEDISPFFERDGVRSTLVPGAVEHGIYNGKLYSLPFIAQPYMTFYNPELFARAALETPNDLHRAGRWDWANLHTVASRISRDEDGDGNYEVWGIGTPVQQLERLGPWVDQAGGWFFNAHVMPTESRFNTPPIRTTLEFLRSLVESGAMPVQAIKNPTAEFAAGTVGLLPDGPFRMGDFRNRNFDEWDIAPVVQGPVRGRSVQQSGGMQMIRSTEHPEAAWKWMRFFSEDIRAIELFTAHTGRPPALIEGLRIFVDLMLIDGRPEHLPLIIDGIISSEGAPPLVPIAGGIVEMQRDAAQQLLAFYRGDQSINNTIDAVHHIITVELDRHRESGN